MIKAEELRIGNYVHNILGDIIKVRGTTKGGIWLSNMGLCCISTNIQPVVLTPEILEKCGFTSKDMADLGVYISLYISHEIVLSLHKGTIWIGEYDTKIQYLHQLQNLYYALTNTELTINL